jgi:hypothetical protein
MKERRRNNNHPSQTERQSRGFKKGNKGGDDHVTADTKA